MAKKAARRKQEIPEKETKTARFIRVVTPRINKAVKAIRLIGFCAGSSYEYTPEQIQQISKLLRSTVEGVEHKLLEKKGGQDEFSFKP